MLFLQLMYLHCLDICRCRCSFLGQCICNLLFFELVDAFQPVWHVNCIYSLLFYGLRILPSQILHLHPTVSMTWGCFTSKLCILNVLFQCLADASCRNFTSSIPENSLAQISSLNILWVLFSSRRPPRKERLCTPAQLRRASSTPIRWIA